MTPKEITAGDSIEWTLSAPAYLPADSWVLSYALVKTGAQIVITGTDNGDGLHKIAVNAATTAVWTDGFYKYQAYVTKATDRYLIETGEIRVLPNFSTQVAGYDGRTQWQVILDNLMAALQTLSAGSGTADVVEVEFNGRRVRYSAEMKAQLLADIDRAKREVSREKRAERIRQGLGAGNNIFVRF